MGLPMYQNNDEVDARDAATKPDRAAAARRSTIRREATTRPSRSPGTQTSNSSSSGDDYRVRLLRRRRQSLERDQRQIEHLEAELERLRRNRMRSRARLELENESLANATSLRGDDAALEAHVRRMQGQISPDDVIIRPFLGPFSRDPALRFVEMGSPGPHQSHRSASPRRHTSMGRPYIPSPPHSSDADRRHRLSPDGPLRPLEDGPIELTPNVAPAHGPSRRSPQPSEGPVPVSLQYSRGLDDVAALETPPPEEWEGSYPPLRRVGHLSSRPRPHRSQYDGLGDRRRSVSPNSSDSHEEETWEILMSTMNHHQRPSAQTSFASTTRSDLATGSGQSSQTAATSFGEIGQLDDTCDLDLPFGITEEDARQLRTRHERTARLAAEHDRLVGRHIDTVDEVRRNLQTIERRSTELTMFQNILERLQRRQEVPAEWWATVGLTPNVSESIADFATTGTGVTTDQREEYRANA